MKGVYQMKKEHDAKNIQQDKQDFPEQISTGCQTFTSHELFWRELETIVVDGVVQAEEVEE